jgi:hypothetical protein
VKGFDVHLPKNAMARDFYHNTVRLALERDGWQITHDPYPVRVEDVGYEIDLGAEMLIAAQKESTKIAVEPGRRSD